MTSLVVLLAILPLSQPQQEAANPAIDSLVTIAAADFHAHAPKPAKFRNVRGAYAVTTDGVKHYRLCGEFMPADEPDAKWTPFVTLKTTAYEQWLGAQAVSMCKHRSVKWEKGDLSAVLQNRVDAL